ncbi:MAG: efflux RND transporter periplasmic adaptor subunit [Pirellulales bacterium]|nr:efflux RND transporter periplasmic adaptor subunit [Pirellulales bacterium]
MKSYLYILPLSLLALPLAGCGQAPPPMPPMLPPQVEVALPVYQDIRDYEDFTGQTEAVTSIDVRARVTGYLAAVHFKHGAEVQAGDVLFDIDPPYYKAEAARAEGLVAQAEARLERLKLDFQRSKENLARGVITQSAHDLMTSDVAEAEAALKSAQASLTIANVNLGYTKVRSPIAGRVSRPFIDPGNLVKADDTILTRVVSQNPMWVYFDLDERTLLRLRRASSEGTVAAMAGTHADVLMGLADEKGYPHQGQLNFEDNRVDPSTGTLRVRAVFDNNDRLLSPGLFVRVRVPIGEPYRALLVPESALGTDQGQRFLYVVDDEGIVAYRRVDVGSLHSGLRVVTNGLSPNEKVVVVGLQRVMPGAKVDAKLTEPPAVQAALPGLTTER